MREDVRSNDAPMLEYLSRELGEARRAVEMIAETAPRPLAVATSLGLIFSWGLWLILPMGVLESTPEYGRLIAWFPGWVWGTVFLVIGLVQFVAVIRYQAVGCRVWWRWSTLAAFCCWWLITLTLAADNLLSSAFLMYLTLTLSQVFIVRRI